MKKSKIITEKALIRRINTRLAGTGYYISQESLPFGAGRSYDPHVDPNRKFQILDAVGRELGVLKPREVVGEGDETARRRAWSTVLEAKIGPSSGVVSSKR